MLTRFVIYRDYHKNDKTFTDTKKYESISIHFKSIHKGSENIILKMLLIYYNEVIQMLVSYFPVNST